MERSRTAAKLRRLCMAVAAAFGLLSLGSSAFAANGSEYSLSDSRTYSETGTKLKGGGCAFTSSDWVSATAPVIEVRELSRNDETCQRVVESGVPPRSEQLRDPDETRPGEASGRGSAGKDKRGRRTSRSPSAREAGSSGSYNAKLTGTAWWEDPLNIDVTRVSNTVTYAHYNGCVHNPADSSWSDHWYTTSGWGLVDRNFDYSSQCNYVRSSNYGRYKNGSFCFTVDTYNTYDRNTVHGYPDGLANHILSTVAQGGCVGLLQGNRKLTKWY